jgi:hypothetical protein
MLSQTLQDALNEQIKNCKAQSKRFDNAIFTIY